MSNKHLPSLDVLPPDFMRNVMQQISQYAAAVATSAATASGQPVPPHPTPPSSTPTSSATTTGPNTPTTTPTAPPPPSHAGPQQPQDRVVFTRPPFATNIPPPAFGTRGTTINVRAAMPGQQQGQVGLMLTDAS